VLSILWIRRWTVALSVVFCMAAAGVYLLKATRIYTSHSNVYIEQQGVKIMSDAQGYATKSDSFLYTQAEVFQSAPILTAALERLNYQQMKTFKDVDNVVVWLQKGKDFRVEVGKKDDVVTVSMDSPYPREAAEVVNAVVDAYVTDQNKRKRTTAAEMMKILQNEKQQRDAELQRHLQEMLKFKEDNGALSFQDDKGNIILERLAKLSETLTDAELNTLTAKTEFEQAQAILRDPVLIARFVGSQQTKSQDGNDKELDELRTSLQQHRLEKARIEQFEGQNSNFIQAANGQMAVLEEAIGAKERQIAQNHFTEAKQKYEAALGREKGVKESFDAQQKIALDLNSKAAQFQRLQADVDRTQKQCDLLDSRIKEINVNSEDAGALNMQVLEVGHVEDKPSSPRKALTSAAALLVGLMVGAGLALLRDWLDEKLRTPDDVSAALALPILGIVPHIPGRHSPSRRGQMVHHENSSSIAEAYRTVRTAIHFATVDTTKTIMVTSPTPGDGKSTTAANLAIALAHAGNRTLLLDADLRKPTQHKVFDLAEAGGLTDVLSSKAKLADAIRRCVVSRLYVLPVGPIPNTPSEILTGKRFAQIFDVLLANFDKIVIDTPPVMAVADAMLLGAQADASILVVRTNKTGRKSSGLALESLQNAGANVIGVIVNDVAPSKNGYGYYYGGYQRYGYGSNGARRLNALVSADATANEHAALHDHGALPPEAIEVAGDN
jgi:capsular exopolysaccharide synthesis family protein